MPYVITPIGDEPILLIKVSDPFDFSEEPPAIRSEILTRFGNASIPFSVIFDIRGLTLTLENIKSALADAGYPQGDTTGIFQKYGRMCLVGAGSQIALGVESANRFVPSSGVIKAFDTPEEALAYARAQLTD